MKIIVTGSLGHIGRPLTEQLVQQGLEVTVISSSPNRQQDIEALGAAAAIGSLENAAFLTQTFTGADAAFVMVPPNYAEPDNRAYYSRLAQNYVQAVTQAGVKYVVHLSSYGAHLSSGTGLILGAHDAENVLNTLIGTVVTHLRPAYFYYNLYNFTDMIKQAGFIGANYGGDDKIVMVSPEDIAVAAAQELASNPMQNKVRYIASDDYTASEIAEILGEAIGRPELQWVTFTDAQAQQAMLDKGLPAPFAADFTALGASIHNGKLREDYDRNRPAVMGKVKLKDFAAEFATAYNK